MYSSVSIKFYKKMIALKYFNKSELNRRINIQSLKSLIYYTYHFNISAAKHYTVHLFQRQLRCFRNVIFDKSEAFMFLRYRIPRHIYRFYGAKRRESLSYRILFKLKTNATYINPKFKKKKKKRVY